MKTPPKSLPQWKPYTPPKSQLDAAARAHEYHAHPSLMQRVGMGAESIGKMK